VFEKLTDQTIVGIFAGGLAGAILNQFASFCTRLFMRPVLKLSFNGTEAGCIAHTPAFKLQDGKVVESGNQRYLRMKVRNTGRTAAKNVNLCLTQIDLYPKSGQPRIFATEVLDLKFAMTQDVKFDIGARAHRFVDVFGVAQYPSGIEPQLGAKVFPYALLEAFTHDGKWIPGHYSIAVVGTADNAPSVNARLNWFYDGDLDGTRVLGRD
jgi:hypothetical protein